MKNETKTDVDNSMELIQPQGERIIVTVGGKQFTLVINDFKFADIGKVVGLVLSFGVSFDKLDRNDMALAVLMMSQKLEVVYQIIQIALKEQLDQQGITGEQEQLKWISLLSGIDGIRITSKLVKVNYDFFFQAKEIVMTDFPTLATMKIGDIPLVTTTNETQTDTTIESTDDLSS